MPEAVSTFFKLGLNGIAFLGGLMLVVGGCTFAGQLGITLARHVLQ